MSEHESNRQRIQEEDDEIIIDFGVLFCDIWKGFKKFWWLFLILCSICAAGSYCLKLFRYSPVYQSRASFTISTKASYEESNTSFSFYYNRTTAEQMTNLFPYILSSDVLMELIKEDLGTGSVPGSISASAIPNSNLFTMTVVSADPAMAQRILESVMDHFPEVSRYVIGETKLNIIQPATYPKTPYNWPNYRNAVKKGILVGVGISAVLLLIYALTRKTIRREEDLKEVLNMPCVGLIPQVKFKAHRKSFNSSVDIYNDKAGRPLQEAVSSLGHKVERQMNAKGWKVLLVTSTIPSEGKSTIAWNLAETLAENNQKVLLIDGDLREPSLAKIVGVKVGNTGLYEAVMDPGKAEQAVQKLETSEVYFIGLPQRVKSPVKFLSSPEFAEFIRQQKEKWDYIILDTPPCQGLADASVIADQSDAILYVIRQDTAKRWQIMDGIQNVGGHGISILGGVLNGIESRLSGYGYNYYGKYGYGRYGYRRYGYGRYGYGYGKQSRERIVDSDSGEKTDEK